MLLIIVRTAQYAEFIIFVDFVAGTAFTIIHCLTEVRKNISFILQTFILCLNKQVQRYFVVILLDYAVIANVDFYNSF